LLTGGFEFTETNRYLFVELFIAGQYSQIVHGLEHPPRINVKAYKLQTVANLPVSQPLFIELFQGYEFRLDIVKPPVRHAPPLQEYDLFTVEPCEIWCSGA
jgi:hypothetical protein